MCAYRIAVIEGDGIGPEVVPVAISVVQRAADIFGFSVEFRGYRAGDSALAELGEALPEETIQGVRSSDAAIKGPVGETAKDVIVRLRQMFDLYANLRPAKVYPGVRPLMDGVDILIVRENTEDLYKGYEFELPGSAVALKVVTERASRRIAEYAFREAERRRKHVTIVHKSNVMPKTDGLFGRVAKEVASSHPGVSYREMYVDAASMALIRDPRSFDVLLTMNVYGDILSDEAAQVVGGLGMAPSANIGEKMALFEPVHGSAPDIAGKGLANPYATVLSAAMMLDWLSQAKGDPRLEKASKLVESAAVTALRRGIATPDLGGKYKTSEVGKGLEAVMVELGG
ncbi:isocitrate/isopropylmalate dehydrogenase family protein [Conexivisphaera calida]|uniref:isocitrate/isopropylmalate dehydrogenase family protein n=1 Tax=Conexivisphaera calida TaxID=1874277 RepID=UPI00157B63E2|nr:isocitrate/isopropylmalate dehydrogenase family protein [Conexivisphaera calida]